MIMYGSLYRLSYPNTFWGQSGSSIPKSQLPTLYRLFIPLPRLHLFNCPPCFTSQCSRNSCPFLLDVPLRPLILAPETMVVARSSALPCLSPSLLSLRCKQLLSVPTPRLQAQIPLIRQSLPVLPALPRRLPLGFPRCLMEPPRGVITPPCPKKPSRLLSGFLPRVRSSLPPPLRLESHSQGWESNLHRRRRLHQSTLEASIPMLPALPLRALKTTPRVHRLWKKHPLRSAV